MGNNYLLIDIGETRGQHVLGYIKNDKLILEEIHHFENKTYEKDGEKCWELEHLFTEIKFGIKKCMEIGKLPIFVGVGAWGSDFVLLDKEDKVIGNPVSCHTTIEQLKKIKESKPEYLDRAECMLLIPDYFNFLLTGSKWCEYTNSITTQLVDWEAKSWDDELLQLLGYPRKIFTKIYEPGRVIGNLTLEVTEEVGYDCIMVQAASRSVAAAVVNNHGKELKEEINYDKYEVSAIGNILILMISSHELKDLQAARECLRNTFEENT